MPVLLASDELMGGLRTGLVLLRPADVQAWRRDRQRRLVCALVPCQRRPYPGWFARVDLRCAFGRYCLWKKLVTGCEEQPSILFECAAEFLVDTSAEDRAFGPIEMNLYFLHSKARMSEAAPSPTSGAKASSATPLLEDAEKRGKSLAIELLKQLGFEDKANPYPGVFSGFKLKLNIVTSWPPTLGMLSVRSGQGRYILLLGGRGEKPGNKNKVIERALAERCAA
ncbi:hypothetical protein DFH11DRAFT_832549 [Phellopilus nigrolimitatus]|nr:hypothetical protein DFH11DRAFT_832549 [Phellopilus nigrolimitatus]